MPGQRSGKGLPFFCAAPLQPERWSSYTQVSQKKDWCARLWRLIASPCPHWAHSHFAGGTTAELKYGSRMDANDSLDYPHQFHLITSERLHAFANVDEDLDTSGERRARYMKDTPDWAPPSNSVK
jgi:hypothetical protein